MGNEQIEQKVTVGAQEAAFADSLAAATALRPEDAAGIRLAQRYATLLDESAPAAKYTKALAWLENFADDEDALKHVETIRVALSEHSVAGDLGPKYLAALTALGMTPAARAVQAGQGCAGAVGGEAQSVG